MANRTDRPRQSGVSHLGFSVTDLDRSISFYCDVLGARLVRAPNVGERQRFSGRQAILLVGSTALDLNEHNGNDGDSFEPTRTGLDHLAFAAHSVADLEAWAQWLDAHGVERSEIRDPDNVGGLFDFVDPDGIQLEFCFIDEEKLSRYPSAT